MKTVEVVPLSSVISGFATNVTYSRSSLTGYTPTVCTVPGWPNIAVLTIVETHPVTSILWRWICSKQVRSHYWCNLSDKFYSSAVNFLLPSMLATSYRIDCLIFLGICWPLTVMTIHYTLLFLFNSSLFIWSFCFYLWRRSELPAFCFYGCTPPKRSEEVFHQVFHDLRTCCGLWTPLSEGLKTKTVGSTVFKVDGMIKLCLWIRDFYRE